MINTLIKYNNYSGGTWARGRFVVPLSTLKGFGNIDYVYIRYQASNYWFHSQDFYTDKMYVEVSFVESTGDLEFPEFAISGLDPEN